MSCEVFLFNRIRKRPGVRLYRDGTSCLSYTTVVVMVALGYCSLLFYITVGFYSQGIEPSVLKETDLINESLNTTVPVEDNKVTLDDIFISVKTSQVYENTRLPIILKTWFQLAKEQTWFFTDTLNPYHQEVTGGHMVNTNCSRSHSLKDLCCKTEAELDYFLGSKKKWFCHFDDDNYVNVPQLVKILQRYDPRSDYYLGRKSVRNPINIVKQHKWYKFWFATGGAGYCISRSLALKMSTVASGGMLIGQCERLKTPDDVTVGFIIEKTLKTKLTMLPNFHSHYEELELLERDTFRDQVSFSYKIDKPNVRVINVPGFNIESDPTRRDNNGKNYSTCSKIMGRGHWWSLKMNSVNVPQKLYTYWKKSGFSQIKRLHEYDLLFGGLKTNPEAKKLCTT